MAAPAALPLDELELVVVVDNESDTLSSVDPGVPQLPELRHLLERLPTARTLDGHPGKQVFDRVCCACHGLSVLASSRRGEQRHGLLFDVGPYAEVWLANAQRLELELASIEVILLSHWHYDHSGALPEVVQAVAQARQRAGRGPPTVDLHPDRPDQRGLLTPSGTVALLPPEPTFAAIVAAGGRVARSAEPHALCDGAFFASGKIDRVTAYETGLPGHLSVRGDAVVQDPLILDERFVAAEVRGRGVSVLSACSHAGVVNACLGARAAFPDRPIDVVLGGYHLAGAAVQGRIPDTVRDLAERIQPRVVAPGHCTGWRAKAALAAAFAPGRYAPSVVGSRYRLQED